MDNTSPTSIPLTITRGDTKIYTLRFVNKNNQPIDITGWKIYFTVKSDLCKPDDDAVIKKDIVVHTNPLNGETQISLSSTDTSVDPGNYLYDIQIKTATDEVYTICQNGLTIAQDVTQRSN
jgi:hypothetical protein